MKLIWLTELNLFIDRLHYSCFCNEFFLRKSANELAHRSLRSVFFPTLCKDGLLFNTENRTLYGDFVLQCKYQCDVQQHWSPGDEHCAVKLFHWFSRATVCKLHNPLGSCSAHGICSESERERERWSRSFFKIVHFNDNWKFVTSSSHLTRHVKCSWLQ